MCLCSSSSTAAVCWLRAYLGPAHVAGHRVNCVAFCVKCCEEWIGSVTFVVQALPVCICVGQPAMQVVVSHTAVRADSEVFPPALTVSHANIHSKTDALPAYGTLRYDTINYSRCRAVQGTMDQEAPKHILHCCAHAISPQICTGKAFMAEANISSYSKHQRSHNI
jgi:hypothetical protein